MTVEQLENRIRYKNRAVWLIGLSWVIISGLLFYLLYFNINALGLFIILSLITFVINLTMGFALKAPKLLIRNVPIYPFGIVVALVLNEISPRWIHAPYTQFGFGISYWFGLCLFYLFVSVVSYFLLRLAIGYETTLQNPISSYSFYLKPTEEDAIVLLQDFISLFVNVSPRIFKEDELTWLKFDMKLNKYAIAFTPKSENGVEVNIFACKMQRDIVCEADREEADIIISVINSVYSTWKKQGYIDEWRAENLPEHSEALSDTFLKTYTTPAKIPFKVPPIKQLRYSMIEWLKRNKKEIIIMILTAIVSPLIIYFVTRLIG